MKLASDTVRIRHLHLQGTAQSIETARSQLNLALQQCNWPVTASEEIILLRRIQVKGNVHGIAAHAAEQSRRLARSAVDGWSATAVDALAVRFSNHASLVACLLRDLLSHEIQKYWYWHHWRSVWQQSMHTAIVTLLQDAPLFIPEVIARLQATPSWPSFWRELGHDGAVQLLTAIAQATGWQAITHTMQGLNKQFTQSHELNESLGSPQGAAVYPQSDFLPLPSSIQPYDLSFLATDTQTPHTDARFMLGAVLALWRHAPALLTQSSGTTALQMLARTSAGQVNKQPVKAKLSSEPAYPTLPASSIDTSNQPSDSDYVHDTDSIQKNLLENQRIEKEKVTTYDTLNDQSDHRTASIPNKVSQLCEIALSDTQPSIRIEKFDSTSLQNESLPTQTSANSEDRAIHFMTQQGGLFYLLNFLNLPVVRKQMPVEHPGTGWRCLFDLARAFDCTPSGALLDFIATECLLPHPQALLQQTPIVAVDQLMRLGASRYGDSVWQAASWKLPARLVATSSHIDLHFRLNDARFEIRRTGLDMNPGWLPWLGRVVTFHYGSDDE